MIRFFGRKRKTKKTALPRQRRQWWQVALRVLTILAIILTITYAALPWWLPKTWLKNYIADDMQRQMGVGVTINELRVNWSDGLELRGIKIDSPAEFGAEPIADIESIRFDFSPLTALFKKKIDWMEINSPNLFVRFDDAGNCNATPLTRLKFDIESDQTSIHEAVATLKLPDHDKLLRLNVGDMQLIGGQLENIKRITMSASFEQPTGDAPISLKMAEESGKGDITKTASFSFSNIDLEQLPLAKLLGLPVSKFAGRSSGLLELQCTRQGKVEQFNCNITIQNLQAQPIGAEQLPVIPNARLIISAALDPIVAGTLKLNSIEVLLPGIDLIGSASMSLDVLAGGWQAIDNLDMTGTIDPAKLAAVFTGKPILPSGITAEGPVFVSAKMRHDGPRLKLSFSADGRNVTISRDGRILKPAGRKLLAEIDGELDHRTSSLTVVNSKLELGENHISGHGKIHSIRRLAEAAAGIRSKETARTAIRELANLEWESSWHVSELESLADLHPGIAAILGRAKLTGHLEGKASASPDGNGRLTVTVEIPADTKLSLGKNFVKPKDQTVRLEITGTANEAKQAVSDIKMSLAIGKTLIELTNGNFGLNPKKESFDTHFSGILKATDVEHLCDWLPKTSPFRNALRGSLRGEIDFKQYGNISDLHVEINLADLVAEKNDFFVKTENEPAEIIADISLVGTDGGAPSGEAEISTSVGYTELQAVVAWSGRQSKKSNKIVFLGNLDIFDAGWLLNHCPILTRRMKGGKLSGPISAMVQGNSDNDRTELLVGVNADKLNIAIPGKHIRIKRADVPMAAVIQCTLQKGDNMATLAVKRAKIAIAKNSIEASGEAVLDSGTPKPTVKKFNAEIKATITADEILCDLLPELAELAGKCNVAGSIAATATINGDENRLSLKSNINADKLSFDEFKLFEPNNADPLASKLAGFCRLAKPSGLPASSEIELSASSDWSKIKINHLGARIGDIELLADGNALLTLSAAGLPVDATLTDAHIAITAERLDKLATVLPALSKTELAGDATIEAELTNSGGTIEIPYVTAVFNDITGLVGEYEFLVNGGFIAEKISLADKHAGIGRVWTEGLKLHLGSNRIWLLGDITDPLDKPAGTIDVLAEQIDDREIMKLLARFTPDGKVDNGFDDEVAKQLANTAQQAIDRARPLLMSADLKVRLSIDRLLTFDKSIEQLYDVRHALAGLTVLKGRVTASYDAGLNGGMLRTQMTTHLADAEPTITRTAVMLDLVAAENLQPQLERFFPGNICRGSFTRSENVQMPLRDMLANAMDARYTLRPVGEAKTITTDGTLIGKGAPDFVTAVFPGLNLTKYNYKKMTGFAEFVDDGSAVNDMVFSGDYDLYIEGVTDADNIGRYQVGVILLGSPQSPEWNHIYKQGRLPILKWKARIENGKLYDEVVKYPWPNETLFTIVLKNNIFYRLWLNRDKGASIQTKELDNQ